MTTNEQAPYTGNATQLILRDHLAIDRTRLANERTLLAWWRTGLTLVIAGVTLIKLFPDTAWMVDGGYVMVPLGFCTLGMGVMRYLSMRRVIQSKGR
jgi:putative membrane protein